MTPITTRESVRQAVAEASKRLSHDDAIRAVAAVYDLPVETVRECVEQSEDVQA